MPPDAAEAAREALQQARLTIDAMLEDKSMTHDDPRWLAALAAETQAAEALGRVQESNRRRRAATEGT